MGYNFTLNYASQGAASFYATLPAQVSNQTQINTDYAPIIKKGTAIRSIDGDSFILTEDVNFADPDNQREVSIIDETTGLVSYYAVRAVGKVMSGRQNLITVDVGDFERFAKVVIDEPERGVQRNYKPQFSY